MPDNRLELVVEVDVDRANASIKSTNKGLSSFEQAAKTAARAASLASARLRGRASQLARIDLGSEILGNRGNDGHARLAG
jgi:hypothetical protein